MPNGCRAPWRHRGARLRRQIGWCDAPWALPGSRQNADQGAERRGPNRWNPETVPCSHRHQQRRAPRPKPAKFYSSCLFKLPPNVIKERRLGAWRAGARTGRAASASVPTPGTRSPEGQAPACPPRPADDGRRCAGRSPGMSRSLDRRHPAKASQRPARRGSSATTTYRGHWSGVGSSDQRRAPPLGARPCPPSTLRRQP
jgi:hypothetical protein